MNTQITKIIRQTEPWDAESLAKLINLAGEGIPNWLWTRACVEGQTPLEIGIERARRRGRRHLRRHGVELRDYRGSDRKPG